MGSNCRPDTEMAEEDIFLALEEPSPLDGLQEEDTDHASLGLSESIAKNNYMKAGTLVEEPPSHIVEEKYKAILVPRLCEDFEKVVQHLPYTPVAFQKIGAIALASGHHVALRVATGEGKMSVPLIAIEMLNLHGPGKVIVTQPLDGLLMQSLGNQISKAAMISMGGEVLEGGEKEGKLSHSLDYILSDEVKAIFGHAESFSTPVGRKVLGELERRGLLKLVVFDEVHTALHWRAFREDILRINASIRAFAPSVQSWKFCNSNSGPPLDFLSQNLVLFSFKGMHSTLQKCPLKLQYK